MWFLRKFISVAPVLFFRFALQIVKNAQELLKASKRFQRKARSAFLRKQDLRPLCQFSPFYKSLDDNQKSNLIDFLMNEGHMIVERNPRSYIDEIEKQLSCK